MSSTPERPASGHPRVVAAYQIMQQVYDQCQAAGASLEETHLAIRAAYPWGARRKWPYKAWLIARREFYEVHNLPIKARRPLKEAVKEITK